MSYEPRGKVKALCDAMAPHPEIALPAATCSQIMGVLQSNLPSHLMSAVSNHAIYPIQIGNRRFYGLTPNAKPAPEERAAVPLADRQTTSNGWTPPKMTPPRGTSAPVASATPAPIQPPAAPVIQPP